MTTESRFVIGIQGEAMAVMDGRQTRRTALYRHFDRDGALLYVGISLNSIQRTMQHRQGARWFEQIARIAIEWLPTREAAEAAERAAIKAERPKFNVVHAAGVANPAEATESGWRDAYAVTHTRSGWRDGWYTKELGEHMLGWFRALFPRDEFQLTRPRFQGDAIGDGRHLDWGDWRRWGSATPPDHAAADRYEREHA